MSPLLAVHSALLNLIEAFGNRQSTIDGVYTAQSKWQPHTRSFHALLLGQIEPCMEDLVGCGVCVVGCGWGVHRATVIGRLAASWSRILFGARIKAASTTSKLRVATFQVAVHVAMLLAFGKCCDRKVVLFQAASASRSSIARSSRARWMRP